MKAQFLTLEIAKTLIGKKIQFNAPVYSENAPVNESATVLGVESEWDLAGKVDWSQKDGGKYATQQDYWKSYFSEDTIKKSKNKMSLICDKEVYVYSLDGGDFIFGDADRFVTFTIVKDASFKVKIECHGESIVFDALNIQESESDIKNFILNNCLNRYADISYIEINSVKAIESFNYLGSTYNSTNQYFDFKENCFLSHVVKGTEKRFTKCKYTHEFDCKTNNSGYVDKDLTVNYNFNLLVDFFNSDYEN